MKLTDVCIARPTLAWMMLAATLLFGGVAAQRIGISQFPDVDYPMISVSVAWEGAAAEVMERDVVGPLEEAMTQVEGVRHLYAVARQGTGWVGVEFDLSRNIDLALQDVQSQLSRAMRALPRHLEPPTVTKSNPEDQPIMWVALSGALAPQELADLARFRIADRLQTVPGVGEITLGGHVERNIRLWLDADRLNEHSLTVLDVEAALQKEHIERPAGRLETDATETNVRVVGEAPNLTALRRLVVRQTNNAVVRLEDVALVEDGFDDVRRVARVGGQPAQGLGIRKQRGANAVAVARDVRAALRELQAQMPAASALSITFDTTRFIQESVHEIEWEIVVAIVLTALVCWAALGSWTSTINVVLAIPVSILGCIGILYFLGFTLNTFTLLALGLAVGLVVDDAIMVLENIFRCSQLGLPPAEAARRGTREISFAALSATLAIVAIFAPVIFMRGVIGRFFLQFGVALSVAVLLSYVEAMTLAPARCAQLLAAPKRRPGRLGHRVQQALEDLSVRYGVSLGKALRHPYKMLGCGLVVFMVSLLALWRLPAEFVPSQDQSRLLVRMDTVMGVSLAQMDALVQQAEAVLRTFGEVERDFTVVGGGGVNRAFMFVTLVPPHLRHASQAQVATRMRDKLSEVAGLHAIVQDMSQSGFAAQGGFPVAFSLRGPQFSTLLAHARTLSEQLQHSGLVADLHDDHEVGMPELRLIPNREHAAAAGVSTQDIALTLEALIGGVPVAQYSVGGRRIDVKMRLLKAQRNRPEDLNALYVRSQRGNLVPLRTLLQAQDVPVLRSIVRSDRERAINFAANTAPGQSQAAALSAVRRLGDGLPSGYHLQMEGSSATFKEAFADLAFALVLGVVVAYMVLAAQFDSLLHPLTVLAMLPLSVAGAFIALWCTGQSLNIFSFIGLLLLLGLVKKNAILLVDCANQARRDNPALAAVAAMCQAAQRRLRPILMTSVATMMAVLPSVFSLGPGSETRGPMGIAVLGGLLVSTTLSLFVIPAVYVLLDRLAARLQPPPPIHRLRNGQAAVL